MSNSYKMISDAIIERMRDGEIPWIRPWSLGTCDADPRCMAVSHATGRAYSLLNQIIIGDVGEYATFHQINASGGSVKKGAKAKHVYFWSKVPVKARKRDGTAVLDEQGNEKTNTVWYLKPYSVFDVTRDAEGVEPVCLNKALASEKEVDASKVNSADRPEHAFRSYIEREGISFLEAGNRAFYRMSDDSITVPPRAAFDDMSAFYETLFHEIGHSTGTEGRMARKLGGAFGSYDYGREELVAEMTSAFICSTLGLPRSITRNAAYIQYWIKAIGEDSNMVVYAATKAEKAVEFILTGKRPERKGEDELAA